MKTVKTIGNYVIKETNEKERSFQGFSYQGSQQLENFYVFKKGARKFDDYTDYTDTLEEAEMIIEYLEKVDNFSLVATCSRMALEKTKYDNLDIELNKTGIEYTRNEVKNLVTGRRMAVVEFSFSQLFLDKSMDATKAFLEEADDGTAMVTAIY